MSENPRTDGFFESVRRSPLRRSRERWLGGVCGGLADRLGVDPAVVRVVAVVLGLLFGLGLLLYLIAWSIMPETDGSSHLERGLREGSGSSLVLLVVTAVVGVGVLVTGERGVGGFGIGPSWLGFFVVLLAILGAIAWGVWRLVDRPRRDHDRTDDPGAGSGVQTPPGGAVVLPAVRDDGSGATYAAEGGGVAGATASYPAGGGWAGGATASYPAEGGGAGGVAAPPRLVSERPPPPPPAPRRPRRRPPGPLATLVVIGAALVVAGAVAWCWSTLDWPGSQGVMVSAAVLATLGVGVLVLALAGRRTGFSGFLASLALVVTALAAVSPVSLEAGWRVGDVRVDSAAVVEGDGSVSHGVGVLEVDLRDLDPATVPDRTVRASLGVGLVRILAPEDLTVEVVTDLGAGEILVRPPDGDGRFTGSTSTGGLGVSRSTVLGDGPSDLVVDVDAGMGQIVIDRSTP